MDRQYTTIPLALRLKRDQNVFVVGTIMKNRSFLPHDINSRELANHQWEIWNLDNKLSVQKTKDNNTEFILINSCYGSHETTYAQRWERGVQSRIEVSLANSKFNNYAKGVDLFNKCIAVSRYQRKATKWHDNVFKLVVASYLINSWSMYKHLSKRNISFKDFSVDVALSLMKPVKKWNQNDTERRSTINNNDKPIEHKFQADLQIKHANRLRCKYCKTSTR